MFLREQANKMYYTFAYYFAKTVIDFPMLFFTTLVGVLITYFAISFEFTAEQFFMHLLSIILINMYAQALGIFLSSLFESELGATQIAPVFVMPFLLFGGLFTNNKT